MSSNKVRLVVTQIAQEGKAEQLGDLLRGLIAPTRQESGCLRYELWQNEDNEHEFRFIEEWESSEALDAHLQKPYIKNAQSQLPGLLAAKPDFRKYQTVE